MINDEFRYSILWEHSWTRSLRAQQMTEWLSRVPTPIREPMKNLRNNRTTLSVLMQRRSSTFWSAMSMWWGLYLLYIVPWSLTQLGSGEALDMPDIEICDGCDVIFRDTEIKHITQRETMSLQLRKWYWNWIRRMTQPNKWQKTGRRVVDTTMIGKCNTREVLALLDNNCGASQASHWRPQRLRLSYESRKHALSLCNRIFLVLVDLRDFRRWCREEPGRSDDTKKVT